MKLLEVAKKFDTAVSSSKMVVFSVTKDEAEEVRNAIRILDKYRKEAVSNIKPNPDLDDWVTTRYSVNKKGDRVFVEVTSGMAG